MTRRRSVHLSFGPPLLAAISGAGTYRYVSLQMLEPAFGGMLVAVSMFGGAVLVRLARNSPITQPAAFDDADLNRFFDALKVLADRLFFVFAQVLGTLVILLVAIIASGVVKNGPAPAWTAASPYIVGALGFSLTWLATRLIEVARGDAGVLQLQRSVLQNALNRERARSVDRKLAEVVEFKSAGGYGRALPPLG